MKLGNLYIGFQAYERPLHCVFIPTISLVRGMCQCCGEPGGWMLTFDFLTFGVALTFTTPNNHPHPEP